MQTDLKSGKTCTWCQAREKVTTVPSENIHHAQFPTPETVRGMGTSFRRNGLWDRLGGQALVMIG